MDKSRCEWASSDPLYVDYHDNEWGVPLHDDQMLFEFLVLEGMQPVSSVHPLLTGR